MWRFGLLFKICEDFKLKIDKVCWKHVRQNFEQNYSIILAQAYIYVH